ncbi:hypothetical protein CWATWH8502_1290 [Crocosphaera watsonii WH 8502]|uniref:Uncharacterized protein n=1 Tax=Crocosphaera watsonii WH 8502 TaxID=423474 RepID=T2IAC3_CROWT|nr:hypothetical protein CWATWH8502_1290 [Crocosphaera watsonii WH 8502]
MGSVSSEFGVRSSELIYSPPHSPISQSPQSPQSPSPPVSGVPT